MDSAPFAILHIPHASREIPSGVRDSFLLSDTELNQELIHMTDSFTDELFAVEESLARRIVFPISRLVVDPERFVDDADEPMSKVGMGVIYTKTSSGHKLRRDPSARERSRLIDEYYRPHHSRLLQAVDDALAAWGRCLIVDCHSFASVPLPYEPDQSPDRPDVCVGTDELHTAGWLSGLAIDLFRGSGLIAEINRPYAGTLVPSAHYRKNADVWSVMLEINRRLYMDETRGTKNSEFAQVRAMLEEVLKALILRASCSPG